MFFVLFCLVLVWLGCGRGGEVRGGEGRAEEGRCVVGMAWYRTGRRPSDQIMTNGAAQLKYIEKGGREGGSNNNS